jgi:tetratricopeptide (TPR) repeat protein
MIAELSGRRLVQLKVPGDKQTLSIHRLLQEKILHDLDVEELNEVFGKAYCLVRKQFPRASPIQVPEPYKATACKEYAPHVLSLRRAFDATAAIEPSLDLAELFYDAGFHVWELQTAPDEGVLYLETAERILDRLNYDPHAKIRADIHTAIAMLYSIIGIRFRTQNLQRFRDAHTIRQKVYELDTLSRENDILCTNAASDLGYYLFETWEYEEASKIFQACYRKYQEWGTETEFPFEYMKYYFNNARLCMHRGNYLEAINLFRRAIELSEKALGKTWFYLLVQFNLACTMLQAGDLQSALDMHLKVFAAQEKAMGKYDSATIMSNYAVGAVHYYLGDFSAAA